MYITTKNTGNILLNSLLALALVSIAIVGISKSINQSTTLQDQLIERDLLDSFVDEVVDDYIPLVYSKFTELGYYIDFHGQERAKFTELLDEQMATIDFSSYLNCNASYKGHPGGHDYEYEVVCTPPSSSLKYIIEFNVYLDYKESGTFYFTFDHIYFSEAILAN